MNQIYTFWIILSISLILQGSFFVVILKLLFYEKNQISKVNPQKSVSVVIAARNEANNLGNLLTSIFNQGYKNFELIVVNDRSEDNSLHILEQFKENNPTQNFHFISIKEKPQNWNGKKYALQKGIKAAKNEIILLTDADCLLKDKYWIEKMASSFNQNNKKIDCVVGISLYKKEKNNFPNSILSWFIQNETLIVALQYISFANFGMAYMGVGRNLAYKKSVFMSSVETPTTAEVFPPMTNTFEKIASQMGGDDDLIFSEKRFYKNVGVCLNGQTESKAPQNFKEWLHQKRRHLAVGTKYSFRQKVISSIYPLSIFSWYIAFLGFLINGFYEVLAYEFFRQLLFFSILHIFYNQIQNNYLLSRFNHKNFLINFLREFFITFFCFEFVFIFYYFVVGMGAVFFPPKKWK
ncbi:glycosyl transferase [Bernardetia litoralis DSM 6794]|uniref:Glycosyl transferase n=1 Tax=Bernardetia litoralis (strain ATCC 23117 / DSM 6794 / NBRC 15988 / NCIMB 1366 / Fx l1 / Sio-4) TaxID=880071 RepID=I4AIA0_BERLS|nr:glycosyltransferase [Bernardetia litoralis]AFM03685.1 glycosyl transferase [Bernardetia litoralis DSM 6794]